MKSVTIETTYDFDASVDDADCYTQSQVEAWRNDEWRFIGVRVVVTETHDSYDTNITTDWLWGIETYEMPWTDEDDNNIDFQKPLHHDYYIAIAMDIWSDTGLAEPDWSTAKVVGVV